MSRLPTTLTHLYMNPAGPFRSITAMTDDQAFALMDQMTAQNTWYPPRFSKENRTSYLAARRRTEQRLYDAFVRKGGCPPQKTPFYFSLETEETETFYPEAKRIHIPLSAIPENVISFTYLDSMVCDSLMHTPERVPPDFDQHFNAPWVNRIYRFSELTDLINDFGYPDNTYIEAQVWDIEPLKPFSDYARNS